MNKNIKCRIEKVMFCKKLNKYKQLIFRRFLFSRQGSASQILEFNF